MRKLTLIGLVIGLLMFTSVISTKPISAASRAKAGTAELPNNKNATCAKGGKCKVGDTGPGGGVVFFASKKVFASIGSACGSNCRYLEASPTDLVGRFTWNDANSAASSCKGCRLAGWRLPTLDELKILYRARFKVAGFLRNDLTTPFCPGYWEYWSSTPGELGYWYWNFDSYYGYAYPPYFTKCVRPVRSFG